VQITDRGYSLRAARGDRAFRSSVAFISYLNLAKLTGQSCSSSFLLTTMTPNETTDPVSHLLRRLTPGIYAPVPTFFLPETEDLGTFIP